MNSKFGGLHNCFGDLDGSLLKGGGDVQAIQKLMYV